MCLRHHVCKARTPVDSIEVRGVLAAVPGATSSTHEGETYLAVDAGQRHGQWQYCGRGGRKVTGGPNSRCGKEQESRGACGTAHTRTLTSSVHLHEGIRSGQHGALCTFTIVYYYFYLWEHPAL